MQRRWQLGPDNGWWVRACPCIWACAARANGELGRCIHVPSMVVQMIWQILWTIHFLSIFLLLELTWFRSKRFIQIKITIIRPVQCRLWIMNTFVKVTCLKINTAVEIFSVLKWPIQPDKTLSQGVPAVLKMLPRRTAKYLKCVKH